ncbi:MAG: hypothetical protein JWO80_1168 [Bryobacterales bacterium]|nr:hypothetical protein [Bryobacterales bacterium]
MNGLLLSLLLFCVMAQAAVPSALFRRGYTVIPEPQHVQLTGGDFRFDAGWKIQQGPGVSGDSVAIRSLTEGLAERYGLALTGSGPDRTVVLEIRSGAVEPGASQDRDRAEIASQAYHIIVKPAEIRLIANAEPGLFYAAQTLLQLLNAPRGNLHLPEGELADWPDLQMRQIYWDDAHHLEKLSDLKAAVRQAAFFKINGFILKLEGHFQYRSAPAIVEPQALSPQEFQELTDYALRYYVQVIPYLDAPAHIAFILKHPEYKALRAFPDSNYELCTTNPNSLKLIYGMYDDLLAANKGVKYFYLSTDEAYYVGWADNAQCREATQAKELGSRGKLLAEFVSSAANYLHERGRTVVFWGEYPLKPEDLGALPTHIVNGETYGDAFDPIYKKRGIRQMIYNATEGEEQLFPQYYLWPPIERIHPLHETERRVQDAVSKIITEPARRNADLLGLVIAGWGDMGVHPEAFWLGYAAITATGWNPAPVGSQQSVSSFYPLFYGAETVDMDRVYQLMSFQTQMWTDTWDVVDSTARKPIWGNSDRIFTPPHPARDHTVPLPPTPGADLRRSGNWREANGRRLQIAARAAAENDELVGLLNANMSKAQTNRYGLEVFLAIAGLCRQNLDMLQGLQIVDAALSEAQEATEPAKAVAAADRALAAARTIRGERNSAYQDALQTWNRSWLPRVEQANGRRFLHEADDVKDHLPDRTVDMSYLIYRELLLPFDDWYRQTEDSRNQYAQAHKLPEKKTAFNWSDLH